MQKFTPNQLLWMVSVANRLSKTIEVLANDEHSQSNYHSVYVNIFSIYVITLNHDTKYLVLALNISQGIQEDSNRHTEPSGIITSTSNTITYIASNNIDSIYNLAVVATILGKI